jgi:hypothetical protein
MNIASEFPSAYPSAMRVRSFTRLESQNLRLLNAAGIESVPLFLTPTGFKKSICDATSKMREFFKTHEFHDYEAQRQGQDNKVFRDIDFLSGNGIFKLQMSLYRPNTKNGDPRFWVGGWRNEVEGEHVLAFFFDGGKICALNLSTADFSAPFFKQYLSKHSSHADSVSAELLERLRELAKSPIPSSGRGDTFIGRDLEHALGIPINSNPAPDYNGIELKSKRDRSATRDTLFAQVPDWDLSALKSSADILTHFGYQRGGDLKLYCTVSARTPNSQGLLLSVNEAERLLWEKHRNNGGDEKVVAWELGKLEHKLSEKHNETFWIKAESIQRGGREWFLLKSATHTHAPNIPQFSRMLAIGDVTVDHLIKRKTNGRVNEKGPLFKVASAKREELFLGEPKEYLLI